MKRDADHYGRTPKRPALAEQLAGLPLLSGEPATEPAVRQVKVAAHTRTIEGTPAPVVLTEEESLAEQFAAFDVAHPHVYALIESLALADTASGERYISMKGLWERARRELKQRGEKALNNNWTAYYARKLLEHQPQIRGLLRTRALTSKQRRAA